MVWAEGSVHDQPTMKLLLIDDSELIQTRLLARLETIPGVAAIHLIRLMKEMAPAMQIAIFTNEASEFIRRKCLAIGVNWFFDKATELEALLDLVQSQVAQNAATRARKRPCP